MANKQEYIDRLQAAIQQLHKCAASHRETVLVQGTFKGETVWDGAVEVFDLIGHPKALRCYAWSHRKGPTDQGERLVAVLEIPPVESAKTAVQASIMADTKKR